MSHRPPVNHPNPFRPAKDELDRLRSNDQTTPRWKSILKIGFFVLIGLLIIGLHVAGILGMGLHGGN